MQPSRKLYAMKEDLSTGMFEVEPIDALRLNADAYAIYWSVNEFEGARRISNLKKINSWYFELDEGTKESQWEIIEASPIIPSLVIESFRGYHVYFNARDAKPENYRTIEERIIHHFGADDKAKDLARVLRAPGYLHQKKIENPFLVSVKFESEFNYSEKIMLYVFKDIPEAPEVKVDLSLASKPSSNNQDLSTFLDSLDNEWALSVLSGTEYVNYETYSFKKVSRSRKNIVVNGKGTSCFIDEKKRIGANPGGPNVFCWLRYFGISDRDIVSVLKERLGYDSSKK